MEGKDGTELAGRGFSLNNKYQTLEIQNSAAEQQFRANLCKSDFLRDISHFLEAAATPHVFVYPHFWAKQAISTKIQRQIQMPGNNYKFRVFAENVYGRSEASDESNECQTKGILKKKQPKTKYEVDPSTGKKIRGQKCEVKDYDQFVFDIYSKYIPQPVDIRTQQSVYENYDILEEIGEKQGH